MKTCPHCGTPLSEEASFCPHCAKSLIEKTALKPYRTLPLHKFLLPLLAILILGILLALILWRKPAPSPLPDSSQTLATTVETDREITDSDLSLPITEEADTNEQTDSAFSESEESTATEEPVPSTDTDTPTDSKIETEQTDSVIDSSTDSVTDDTQIIYTPETAPLNGTYLYKGVEWYFQSPANKSQYPYTYAPYEPHEVYFITGVNSLAIDGIYYMPDTIYGKPVVLLFNDPDTEAQYALNSKLLKDSLRTIYFPPTATAVSSILFMNSSTVTDIYIGRESFFLHELPKSGNLTIHCSKTCVNTTNDLPFKDQCSSYSTETLTCTWEEWDPSTLYPNS